MLQNISRYKQLTIIFMFFLLYSKMTNQTIMSLYNLSYYNANFSLVGRAEGCIFSRNSLHHNYFAFIVNFIFSEYFNNITHMYKSYNVSSAIGVYNKIRFVSENRVHWFKNNWKFISKLNKVYKKWERFITGGYNPFLLVTGIFSNFLDFLIFFSKINNF